MTFDKKKIFSKSGSPEKIHYDGKIDEKGIIQLIETGKDNIYLQIQAEADSCNIDILLKRFKAGDEQALQRAQFFYGDVSAIPVSPNEILNTVNGAKESFEKMPLEIREKFDFDFNKWFSTMNTDEWFGKMKMSVPDEQKEEVQVDQHTFETDVKE